MAKISFTQKEIKAMDQIDAWKRVSEIATKNNKPDIEKLANTQVNSWFNHFMNQ